MSRAVSVRGSRRSVNVRLASWRLMDSCDLDLVIALGDRIHVAYPEAPEIFIEKQRLFPEGCFTLEARGEVAGYCISHPWVHGRPPKLDAYLESLPAVPETYFLHDIVVAESVRGIGAARSLMPVLRCVARLNRLDSITLVSVNGTAQYWHNLGFRDTSSPALQTYVRANYSDEAVLMTETISRYFET